MKNKKFAFTLSEVLITVGIIGVIAAMTIPTLVASHRKTAVAASLKKFYVNVNQAVELSARTKGPVRFWKFASANNATSIEAWYNEYFPKYFNTLRTGAYKIDGTNYFTLFFADGSAAYLDYMGHDWFYCTEVSAISNFKQNLGRKCFRFGFYPNFKYEQEAKWHNCLSTINYTNKGIEPYVSMLNKNPDGSTTGIRPCTQLEHLYSQKLYTKIIQQNGWRIPDDYPLKF